MESVAGKILGFIAKSEAKAAKVGERLDTLLLTKYDTAIKNIDKFIEKAKLTCCEHEHEAYLNLVGGPVPENMAPVFNALGLYYPLMPVSDRKDVLCGFFRFLNRLNYFMAQNQVERISEPWLVADIVISVPLYWPGSKDYIDILTSGKISDNMHDLENYFKNAKSDFFAGYALLLKEAPPELRRIFIDKCPKLLESVLDGVAAMAHTFAQREAEHEKTDYDYALLGQLGTFCPSLDTRIRKKIEERSKSGDNCWIDISRIACLL